VKRKRCRITDTSEISRSAECRKLFLQNHSNITINSQQRIEDKAMRIEDKATRIEDKATRIKDSHED
jgi:hypothetical protein